MAAGVSVLVSVAVGYIVTVTFCVLEQPFAVNVNTYVAVRVVVPVFTSVSLILALLPLAEPFVPTAARVQLNVVPVVALVAV